MYCKHEDCRAETKSELAYLAAKLDRPDIAKMAANVDSSEVRCRHVPSKGQCGTGVNAPLPDSKDIVTGADGMGY